MKLSEFDYYLPKNLIAKKPCKPRDRSRLLILDKKSGGIKHKKFFEIIDYFKKGDVLVMNNSKVFPARLVGKKKDTSGRIEVFLLRKIDAKDLTLSLFGKLPSTKLGAGRTGFSLPRRGDARKCFWNCIVGGRGAKIGLTIIIKKNFECEIIKDNKDGTWVVRFNQNEKETMKLVEKIGEVPLPPYIKKQRELEKNGKFGVDKNNYQTVYADSKKIGSVAGPTAGFHFTKNLLAKLKKKGVQIEYVTLHVGLGTFAPVKIDDIKKHKMHSEYTEIKGDVVKRIIKAKKDGRRIIAVGTTSVRTLEAVFQKRVTCNMQHETYREWVNIFIYPGFKFKVVDAMITNFHLPKSTLIMLVSALAGKKNIKNAYNIAVEKKYRFYSYGDAMFIK